MIHWERKTLSVINHIELSLHDSPVMDKKLPKIFATVVKFFCHVAVLNVNPVSLDESVVCF